MQKKKFDVFVSYSHEDKALVESLAKALRRRHVRVWIDGWEMKPGDILRDKISDGIANASYFLVVLSSSALASRWVRYELNSGMIDEIEQGHVRVIPAIAGQAEFADLPADLRAKYCLDLRMGGSSELAIEEIVDLVQPEVRRRKELMHRLRNPEGARPMTIAFMDEYANGHRDQAIQVAALRGLEKTPGPQATVAIARRALDTWGCRGIETANRVLSKRRSDGGLLVLAAILPQDTRYFQKKLGLILSIIGGDDSDLTGKFVEISEPDHYHDRRLWADTITLFGNSNIPDLWNGARLSLSVPAPFFMYDRPPTPPPGEIALAEQYAERTVPGFVHVLRTGAKQRDRNYLMSSPSLL